VRKHLIKNMPQIREPYTTIVDDVSEQDRRYFEEHPDATTYIRPSVPGELGPPMEYYAGKLTIVTQWRQGVRHRQIVTPGPSAVSA
jgi:hypothetical protein